MNKVIGIMGAMPEEITEIIQLMENVSMYDIGKRKFHRGTIQGKDVVVVFSRWGKVAAAATATTLIHKFGITTLLFTGLAGAVDNNVQIGDIVIGKSFVQHDLDARPLMPKYEIPLLNTTYINADEKEIEKLNKSAKVFIENSGKIIGKLFAEQPKIHLGNIASGDIFISKKKQKENIHNQLKNILCVEMEGAAIAQVCYEYDIPFAVLRIISDNTNEQSAINFTDFTMQYAGKFAAEIINAYFHLNN